MKKEYRNGVTPKEFKRLCQGGSGGMPSGDAPFRQLVTDADGKTVWEERLAYDEVGTIIEKKTYHSIGHANDVAIYIDTESAEMATNISNHLMAGHELEFVVDGVPYPVVLDLTTGKFMSGGEEAKIPIAKDDESDPDGKHVEMFQLKWKPDYTGDSLPYFLLYLPYSVSGVFYAEIEIRVKQLKQMDVKYLPIMLSDNLTLFDGKIETQESYGMYGTQIEWDATLKLTASYRVTWDGVEYECAPIPVENMTGIGNLGVVTGADGVEPFLLAGTDGGLIIYATSAGFHDLTIVETKTELKEAYLPTLTSPNGTKYRLTVADDGTLSAVQA